MIADPSQTIGNLSPLSTFAARVAQCASSKPSPAQLDAAWAQVLDRMNMGFDAEQSGNPATMPVTPHNIADLVFASEGLAEAMRRATAALASTSSVTTDAVIDVLACDLRADSMIDGRGGVDASERVAAVFRAASGAVLLEMAAKQLRVDGADAMSGMDRAIAQAMPGAATDGQHNRCRCHPCADPSDARCIGGVSRVRRRPGRALRDAARPNADWRAEKRDPVGGGDARLDRNGRIRGTGGPR